VANLSKTLFINFYQNPSSIVELEITIKKFLPEVRILQRHVDIRSSRCNFSGILTIFGATALRLYGWQQPVYQFYESAVPTSVQGLGSGVKKQ